MSLISWINSNSSYLIRKYVTDCENEFYKLDQGHDDDPTFVRIFF